MNCSASQNLSYSCPTDLLKIVSFLLLLFLTGTCVIFVYKIVSKICVMCHKTHTQQQLSLKREKKEDKFVENEEHNCLDDYEPPPYNFVCQN